jgi:hypothetical protein
MRKKKSQEGNTHVKKVSQRLLMIKAELVEKRGVSPLTINISEKAKEC